MKKRKSLNVKNSCGGKGCYINLYILPYSHKDRRRKSMRKERVNAKTTA